MNIEELLKNATARPWQQTKEVSNLRQWSKFAIYSKKPDIVSENYGSFNGGQTFIANIEKQPNINTSKANADLIIHAVNSFEAMLEALQSAFDYSMPIEKRKDLVYNAITKAKGGIDHEKV